MRLITPEQLGALATAHGDRYAPLVLTAGWVGLRWGELAGLRLERIDLLRHKIRVDQQLVEDAGTLSFGPPKTKAGDRTVTMPSGLTDVLAAHFASTACQRSGMAFPTVTGQLMRRSNFRRLWRRKVDGSDKRPGVFAGTDLEGLVFHELRHTAAALAIAHGAHPQTIKERLGHSSITVTMDTYGHLFPSADEALAEAPDAAFRDAHPASAGLRRREWRKSAGETPERPTPESGVAGSIPAGGTAMKRPIGGVCAGQRLVRTSHELPAVSRLRCTAGVSPSS